MAQGLVDDGFHRDAVDTASAADVLWLLSGLPGCGELATVGRQAPQDIAALCLHVLVRTVLSPV